MKDEQYAQLPIELLRPGPYQPRRHFETEKLQELADSIKEQGILQPVIVRAYQKQYEIIAGERRWRAAQLAKLSEVPCIIKPYTDEQAAIAATIENIQREDLNPIEEAHGYKRLIDEFGYTHENLAKSLGMSRVNVSHALRLLMLDEKVQKLISEGALSEGHGKVLAGLSITKQHLLAIQCIQKKWSVRKLEQTIKQQEQNLPPPSLSETAHTRYLALYSQQLSEQFGAEVQLEASGQVNGGWLKIRYYNNDTLEGILQRMGINNESID